MKVLKLNDPSLFEKIVVQRDNNMILPVNDGDGNLIISLEILKDPVYKDIWDDIQSVTTEVEYVPFPTDDAALEKKIQDLDSAKTLVRYDSETGEVKVGTKTVNIKTGEIKSDKGIIETFVTWGADIIKSVGEFFGIK